MANEMRGPLPIKVDATSNGEFRPVPLTEHCGARQQRSRTADRRARQARRHLDAGHSYNRSAERLPRCSR